MLSMLLRDWLSSRSRAVLETSLMTLLLFLRSDWVDRSAHLQINAALQPPPSLHPLRKEQGAHQSRSGVILKLAYSFLLCEKCRLSLNFLFVLDLPPHNAFVVKKNPKILNHFSPQYNYYVLKNVKNKFAKIN